ncbi:MAG TPA: T9SS type A sorting domain-containing protein, partial [Flavobacteriales bacterium]|nr:T9SS type A sorting domain-containing protein [Flavobacteriales bacterium]
SVDLDKTSYSSYGSPRLMPDGNGHIYALSSTYEKTHLYKLDAATGSMVWSRTFDIDFVTEKNPGFDLVLTGDGGIICTGKANADIFMVCISPSGNLNWTKRMNDFDNSYAHAKCITRLTDGNYLMAGFRGENTAPYLSGIFLLKIDSLGGILDYKFYYDSLNLHTFIPEAIQELNNGNIRVTGNGGPLSFADFDASLNLVNYSFWTQLMNAQTTSNCFDMVNDALLVTCGDRVDRQYILRSMNSNAVFCQMVVSGSYKWHALPVNESVYTHDINFNPGPGVSTSVSALFAVTPYAHAFYCGLSEMYLSNNDEEMEKPLAQVYPNPATAGETLTFNAGFETPGSYTLYNASGAVLANATFEGMSTTLSTAGMAAGVYLLRLETPKGLHTHKLVLR